MKIKVITLKDIIKYLAKFSIIFGIIAIFANFFYDKKNIKHYLTLDSTRFISSIKKEILLLGDDFNVDLKSIKKNYISNTINGEFNLFRVVATTNPNNRFGRN